MSEQKLNPFESLPTYQASVTDLITRLRAYADALQPLADAGAEVTKMWASLTVQVTSHSSDGAPYTARRKSVDLLAGAFGLPEPTRGPSSYTADRFGLTVFTPTPPPVEARREQLLAALAELDEEEAAEGSSSPLVEVTDTPQPAPQVWDDSVPPGGFVCSVCRTPVESEPCPEHGEQVTDTPQAVQP